MTPTVRLPGLAAGAAPVMLGGADAPAWDRVRDRLKAELGEQVFASWFARVDFEGCAEGSVRLSVPTRFLKSWIDQNYRERLLALWEEERDDVRRVELSIRGAGAGAKPAIAAVIEPAVRRSGPAAPPPVVLAAGAAAAARAGSDDQFGSPIDKRLTFDSFMVGRANELAHKAAVEIASSAEPLPYNPLYLHGSVGLGKSHLLHAIAHAGRASGRRVVYLTAERFMYGFVQALKAQSAIAFKETLRGIDILLIDDLQFLQGKHMQAEFGHTLNALLDGSRQVVVAADRPPSELETADERMKSRLGGGLVLEIAPPDLELRRKILRAKIDASRERYPDLAVPEAVIAYVAHAVEASGRDLDGAFNRLVAHNQFAAEPLSVEMAEDCLKDLIRTREPKRVKIEDIQRIVAKHHGVSRQDLVSARRTRNVVVPRQVAMYLAKVLTPRSLPEIGRRFGGRDHTTVLHAVRKIDELVKTDERLAQEVELLRRMLLDA
jgi:chromosomal replication initiator protein